MKLLAPLTKRVKRAAKLTSDFVSGMIGVVGGYDAARGNGNRRIGSGVLRSEDDELRDQQRKVLLSTGQSIYRNFSVARWMVSRHLDYVSTFTFQARTGNEQLDRRLEQLVKWASRAENFEVTGRFARRRFTRLGELQRVLNGDFYALKIRSGKIQGIEGERIRTPPYGGLPTGYTAADFTHGVRVNDQGRTLEYCVCRRGKSSDSNAGSSRFEFEKLVSARHMIPFGYFDRFDQIRGISPMAAAFNPLADIYEGSDLAMAKMKISQILAVTFYRNQIAQDGDLLAEAEDDGDDLPDNGEPKYGKLKWNGGPIQLDLDSGDRMEMLESKTPSAEFQAFTQVMIQVALKALDIPYSFFAENFTNYSGARQALLQYEDACRSKREDVQEFLSRWLWWRCMLWIQDGVLDCRPDDLNWEWIPAGMPWIDPMKETAADVMAIKNGLASRTQVLREKGGRDFKDVVVELAAENKLLKSLDGTTGGDSSGVQAQALNGAQIESLLGIVEQVVAGTLPKDSAKAIVRASFPLLNNEQVDNIVNGLEVKGSTGVAA